MEVIIAAITVVGSITSAIASIYVDRKFNRNEELSDQNINITYHEIFNYINTLTKNTLPYMYFGNNITNDMVRSFLKKKIRTCYI